MAGSTYAMLSLAMSSHVVIEALKKVGVLSEKGPIRALRVVRVLKRTIADVMRVFVTSLLKVRRYILERRSCYIQTSRISTE